MKRFILPASIATIVVGLIVGGVVLVQNVSFPVLQPTGDIGVQQRNLLVFTLCLSAIVVVPVFTMLIWFAWRYRENNDKKVAYTPNWSENNKLELLWWGIPILIIGCLAVVTYLTSHSLDPYRAIDSNKKAIEVQVVALQWKWLFIYPEYGVATINHLPVPVDRPIHFILTADAPMSAFWVPSLGSQIYAMNGMKSQLNLIANRSGEYAGYSTNINGTGYSKMKFLVRAQSQQSFDKWVKSAQASTNMLDKTSYDTLAATRAPSGEKTYMLHDPSLYDTIVHMYMMPTQEPAQTTEPTPKMDHSTMSGMHHD